MRLLIWCLAFLLPSFVLTASAADTPKGQLPDWVTPTHYALHLTVLPEDQRFSGVVSIDVKIAVDSNLIWLHGQDLAVQSAKIVVGGRAIEATYEEVPDSGGVAKLSTDKPIPAGNARIEISYTAPFNRQLEGLYRSDEGGDSYAFSQMEPISARLAFPSFDEPRFKTPFDTTLTVRDTHVAVSNTPTISEKNLGNGLKTVTFATTKPLPTYLVAFAVGPLDVVEWKPIRKTDIRNVEIPLRGITARGKGPQIKYALENTEALLVLLEKYFGIAYPYEKLDLVAATDFAAGAMENAGAIFYREPLMLFDANPSQSQKRRYALTHAHEMAHQWFGNLVTPAWWNDIWLNEAFATWMEYRTANEWNPKGEYSRLSVTSSLGAMHIDSWRSARQIAQPIASNDDISNAFDDITYEKGGGVISMFERYYGPEQFRKGVNLHLTRYKFGNATSKQFLQSIADANGDTKGVAAFETFLNQPGVPLVHTELKCAPSGTTLSLSQSRYVVSGAPPDQTWKIPMCVAFGQGNQRQQVCEIVAGRTTSIDLKTSQCPTWVMPNADGAGYYRFSLDDAQWETLVANAATLNEKEVLAALDSLDGAFSAGRIDIDKYLPRMAAFLKSKGAVPPWDILQAPIARLAWIKDTLVSEAQRSNVKALINELYRPAFDALGLDATTALDKENPIQATQIRTPLVGLMAMQAEQLDVRAQLAKRGKAFLGMGGDGKINPTVIDAGLVETALSVAVQDSGTPVVDAIMTHLKTERSAVIRARMLTALTRSTDKAIAAQARALALAPELRTNEVPIMLNGAVREAANAADGWAWFKANFEAIVKRTPPTNQGDLAGFGASICTKTEREEYAKFFAGRAKALTGGPRTLNQTLEQVDACMGLVKQQRGKADKHFAAPPGEKS